MVVIRIFVLAGEDEGWVLIVKRVTQAPARKAMPIRALLEATFV
jgi:hypothetical protein